VYEAAGHAAVLRPPGARHQGASRRRSAKRRAVRVRLEESDESESTLVGSQRVLLTGKASSPSFVPNTPWRRRLRPARRCESMRWDSRSCSRASPTKESVAFGLDVESLISMSGFVLSATSREEQITELQTKLAALTVVNEKLAGEREEYRKLHLDTLELCRKPELGILDQKSERLSPADTQLALALLGTLLGDGGRGSAPSPAATPAGQVQAHTRHKPTGRKVLPDKLPRVEIEILPPEVQQQGLEAFARIGEDVTETVERRPAFGRRPGPSAEVREEGARADYRDRSLASGHGRTPHRAGPGRAGFARRHAGTALAGPPAVHRLKRIYGREGLELARSTVCGWHAELASLAQPLIEAMWTDALLAPYLCTDATGVLVEVSERCRRGHFFVVIAPERHVLFGYSPKHDSAAAVDELLGGFKGYLVADAHAVFDDLYRTGDVIEVACWAHARLLWEGARVGWRSRPARPGSDRRVLSQ
jgi:transposase